MKPTKQCSPTFILLVGQNSTSDYPAQNVRSHIDTASQKISSPPCPPSTDRNIVMASWNHMRWKNSELLPAHPGDIRFGRQLPPNWRWLDKLQILCALIIPATSGILRFIEGITPLNAPVKVFICPVKLRAASTETRLESITPLR